MLWLIALPLGLVVVYLAARFSRFRHWAEPILSVAVALGLLVAFIIWFVDRDGRTPPAPKPVETTQPAGLTAADVALEGLTFEQSQPERSFRLRGTVTNKGPQLLEYFRLAVTLENCPDGNCETIGNDTALILARVPAGQSRSFETFLTFPNREGESLTAPKWTTDIREVRGANR
ncbi:hypothetical protein JVX98_08145 [Ensifer sp. PDNC004]|uniref:hypothetical protein n=1 Tax=unclassified Ensifer TaxID=2633371 RepID=UPI00177E0588|nr:MULTISPECIES: hypothetical protein [unclassified Ensifer]MBD9647935.1 hypothetical protein [Ensifer sp. ENS09]QRY68245.1 hypothetical protein JVX98_08145 [Ensifer sp. PDNC004]